MKHGRMIAYRTDIRQSMILTLVFRATSAWAR